MMSRAVAAAVAVVKGWTWCYTAAVHGSHRTARRAEIAADVHDHLADLTDRGVGGPPAAAEILRRVIAGVPDDMAWALRPGHSEEIMRSRIQTLAFTGWCTALVLGVLNLLGALAGLRDGWRELGEHWWSMLAVAGGVAAVLGFGVTVAALLATPRQQ